MHTYMGKESRVACAPAYSYLGNMHIIFWEIHVAFEIAGVVSSFGIR